MSNTRIKNLSSTKIVINLPGARYLRELMPKQEVRISDDALDEFNYDQGCINFGREGYISVISDDENNIVTDSYKQLLDSIVQNLDKNSE